MKINGTTAAGMVADRAVELRSKIQDIISSDMSRNTKQTKLYNTRRERRVLELIQSLCKQLDEIQLTDSDYETLVMLSKLEDERQKASRFYLEPGENIVSIMERYPNKRGLMKAINEYCDANGLVFDTESMTVYTDE